MGNPNRFQDFREQIATNQLAPATSNLFEVRIPPPSIMGDTNLSRKASSTINYFASTVTVPSRAITTGEINNVGMMRRFATGQTNSEISMSFLVTKDQRHRRFFEKWMHSAASDSDNTVAFYDQYVVDMEIIKWENGANFRVIKREGDIGLFNPAQSTAVYKIFGAFPTNISTMQFDNEQTSLVQMDVQFYFERYRMDQVSAGTLKYDGRPQKTILWDELPDKIAGSGNPDVQRFSV